jgi:hypothetical protein
MCGERVEARELPHVMSTWKGHRPNMCKLDWEFIFIHKICLHFAPASEQTEELAAFHKDEFEGIQLITVDSRSSVKFDFNLIEPVECIHRGRQRNPSQPFEWVHRCEKKLNEIPERKETV